MFEGFLLARATPDMNPNGLTFDLPEATSMGYIKCDDLAFAALGTGHGLFINGKVGADNVDVLYNSWFNRIRSANGIRCNFIGDSNSFTNIQTFGDPAAVTGAHPGFQATMAEGAYGLTIFNHNSTARGGALVLSACQGVRIITPQYEQSFAHTGEGSLVSIQGTHVWEISGGSLNGYDRVHAINVASAEYGAIQGVQVLADLTIGKHHLVGDGFTRENSFADPSNRWIDWGNGDVSRPSYSGFTSLNRNVGAPATGLTLLNSWDAGPAEAGYVQGLQARFTSAQEVSIRGRVKKTPFDNTIVVTLPLGMRPKENLRLTAQAYSPTRDRWGQLMVVVTTGGSLVIPGNGQPDGWALAEVGFAEFDDVRFSVL